MCRVTQPLNIKNFTVYSVVTALTLTWVLWPLIAKAMSQPEQPVVFHSQREIAVLDASSKTWDQIISDPEYVQQLVRAEFPDAPIMFYVARAESQFHPKAKNPNSTATGVFQILTGTWRNYKCVGDILNAEDNIACARIIYNQSKLSPWEESRPNWGRYL